MPADRTGGRIADNVLDYGDNLGILRHDLKDQSVDLVSLDLRFNSNASRQVEMYAVNEGVDWVLLTNGGGLAGEPAFLSD
jgi:hypothetical protein